MTNSLAEIERTVSEAQRLLLGFGLSAEYRYKLQRDMLRVPPDDAETEALRQCVLNGEMVAEVAREQLSHGGWARFGTPDMTVKKKAPTTNYAVRRLVWLGLGAEDEPLKSALEYLVDVYEGRLAPPEGGEVNERWPEVLRIRCAALIAAVDPYAPCLDELLERWRFIAGSVFGSGSYDYAVCRELQAALLNVTGARLIPIPSQLLARRRGFLPEELERALLGDCWLRHAEGFLYWPEAKLVRLPERFRNAKSSRFMNTIESMVCFRNAAGYLEPAILWLLRGRGEDGLWDYGPQARDPGGYPRRLAAPDWKTPMNRKLDCTMEVLMILRDYLGNNR